MRNNASGEKKFRLEIRRILAVKGMKYLIILQLGVGKLKKSLAGFVLSVINFTWFYTKDICSKLDQKLRVNVSCLWIQTNVWTHKTNGGRSPNSPSWAAEIMAWPAAAVSSQSCSTNPGMCSQQDRSFQGEAYLRPSQSFQPMYVHLRRTKLTLPGPYKLSFHFQGCQCHLLLAWHLEGEKKKSFCFLTFTVGGRMPCPKNNTQYL